MFGPTLGVPATSGLEDAAAEQVTSDTECSEMKAAEQDILLSSPTFDAMVCGIYCKYLVVSAWPTEMSLSHVQLSVDVGIVLARCGEHRQCR